MHEDTQYNVDCGAGEPTKEEHPCCKGKTGYLCNDSSKILFLQGCQKGYLYAVYALIYKATVQDDAWNKNDVEPEEMWFGVFFYQNKNILHRCRSPPLKFGNLLISNFGGRK